MPSLTAAAQRIADLYQPPATGRPAGIGDATAVQEFLDAIAAGNYIDIAARIAGFSKATVYNWLKRGEQHEEPYTLFLDAVEKAQAKAEALEVSKVRKAGEDPRFWAASMTFLERRHPERWARRSEDSSAPRVVVQIGVKDSDVQVQIATEGAKELPQSALEATFACSTQALSEPLHRLSDETG